MPGLYEYTISMNDKASGGLQRLTGASFEAVQKFVQLDEKTAVLKNHIADFGNGIGALKQKIDLLQQERDLIDPANITTIQAYNREINSLSQSINNLETDTGGSKMGKNLKDAFSQLPGAHLVANPIIAIGTAVAGIGKIGMDWDTGMAKINTTAQMSDAELNKLSKTIARIGKDARADLRGVPTAYESIISQTGDAAWATEILETSLYGAKGGFTQVEVTSKALAQSLSSIGKGKATAAEVMDVLFASKRVGAGEFEDFANNIPGLIASGKNVGVTWREVSGAFAYMTGKGNDASSATMLLQNAFTALGKSEITGGLKAAGVEVYDAQGKMRGILPIMEDLSKLMGGMSDEQKSDFLESIGLKDAQAKQAFAVLTDETSKLKEAMDATANATGEMQRALDEANTPMNMIKGIWTDIQFTAKNLYVVLKAVLVPVIYVVGGLFSGLAWVVESVGTAWGWWTAKLQEGNPWIVGLTTLLGGLAAVMALNWAWTNRLTIEYGLLVVWDGILAAKKLLLSQATWAQVAAQWGLNTALLASPITWVVLGVMALVGAFIAAWNYSEKFRGAMTGVGQVLKGFGGMLLTFVMAPVHNIVTGLGSIASMIGKLFKKDFAGAAAAGKEALMSFSGANTVKKIADQGKDLGNKFKTGYAKGVEGFAADKAEKGFVKDENGKWVKKEQNNREFGLDQFGNDLKPPAVEVPGVDVDALLAQLNGEKGKSKGKGKAAGAKKDDTLSLGVPQDYNQTGLYSAINQKFGVQADLAMNTQGETKPENPTEKPVINMATKVDEIAGSLKRMAAAAAIPVAMTLATAGAAQAMPAMPAFAGTSIEQTQVDEPLLANNSYDNSTITTNDVTNSRTDAVNRVSNVTNTDQGKTIRIDRFTDKIEIHIHGTDAQTGQAVAQNVRDEVERALAEILNV